MASQSPSKLVIAAAQVHTKFTTAATLSALRETAQAAASRGVHLILFPECYLGGYPRGCDFGSNIGARTQHGREQFQKYWDASVDLGDTPAGGGDKWIRREWGEGEEAGSAKAKVRGDGTREVLESIASETGVFLVVGAVERAGGSMYCTVVYVCPKKGCLGKRRKVMPTGVERLVWAQGSPSTLRAIVADIAGHKVTLAAAICWENYMPLLRFSLYSQNVNLYLAPTADGRDTWLPLMRTIALESRAYVISSNQCVRERDLPEWVQLGRASSNGTVPHSEAAASATDGSPLRRASTVTRTENNHEIHWPNPAHTESKATAGPQANGGRARRQSSSFASGPNELVLPISPGSSEAAGDTIALEKKKSLSTFSAGDHELCIPLGRDETAVQSADTPTKASRSEQAEEFISHGGSCIVGPDGSVLAGPLWDDPDGIIVAEVDFSACIRGKMDFDAAGSYSRNDSFELKVRGLCLDPPVGE